MMMTTWDGNVGWGDERRDVVAITTRDRCKIDATLH